MTTARFRHYQGTLLSAGMFFAALIGAALLMFSGHTIYRNFVARRWPLTDGRIISSRTFLQDAVTLEPGNAKVARADVRFAYEVNGRSYQSSNISYDRGIGGAEHVYAPSYAVSYPEGTPVKVAYNPVDPADSVIDTSHNPYVSLSLGVLLVGLFVGYQVWLRSGTSIAQ